jgi:Domain of unknown function (DUF4365)
MSVRDSHFTEREGIYAVGLKFSRLEWLFREQLTSDFGIDAQVELVNDGRPSGRLLAMQIKSGRSYLKVVREGNFRYYGASEHLEYWSNHALPVILVLYDPEADIAYWAHVSRSTVTMTKGGWWIDIPQSQQVAAVSAPRFQELAEGDPYLLQLRRLQLDRPWMEALSRGDRLLLEAEEWVNKSSGRGSFRLLLQDQRGSEEVERDWPFLMFGLRPYAEVLPEFFPWADLTEDDEYYEDSSYPDLGDEQSLRPYEEDGEVARWRLEISLNEAGRAFLMLDDFLSDQVWGSRTRSHD